MNKWQKTRAVLKRYDRAADKELAARIGGDYDVRTLVGERAIVRHK